MKKTSIFVGVALVLFLLGFGISFLLFSNKGSLDEGVFKDNHLTFSGYSDSDCQGNVCLKEFELLKIGDNSNVKVRVEKKLEENFLYINDNLVEIDHDLELYYIEPIKYKEKIYENFLLFLRVIDSDGNFSSMLVDVNGKVKRILSTNYYYSDYEVSVLSDGDTYLFYNTCCDNILERHKLNLNNLANDKVIYQEKVVTCD